MAAAKACEKNGNDEAWPNIYGEGYVHQFQPWTSHKIVKQQQKLLCNISKSKMTTKSIPNSTRWPQRLSHTVWEQSNTLWWKAAYTFEFEGNSMEIETVSWSKITNGGKAFPEQILKSEDKNKSKKAGLTEPQSWIWVGKWTIWVSLFETNYNRAQISTTTISTPVLRMDISLSSQKHQRGRLRKMFLCWIKQYENMCTKNRFVSSRGKRSKTWKDGEPVKSITWFEISFMK